MNDNLNGFDNQDNSNNHDNSDNSNNLDNSKNLDNQENLDNKDNQSNQTNKDNLDNSSKDIVDQIINDIKRNMQENSSESTDEEKENLNKIINQMIEEEAQKIANKQNNDYNNYNSINYNTQTNGFYPPPNMPYYHPPTINNAGAPYVNNMYQPPINPYAKQQNMVYNQPQMEYVESKLEYDLNENPEIEDDIIVPNQKNNKLYVPIIIILVLSLILTNIYPLINKKDDVLSFGGNGESPTMDITYTPDTIPNNDPNGVLTNNEIHEKVSPSVVGIAVYTRGLGQVLQSEGSGIIMSQDGFIVTNYHVIANDSTNPVVKIEIIMPDGDIYEARVIGGDSKTDLAVVKIDAVDLVAAEFGDSSKLKIGDRVAVIGNPSGIAFAGSFTQGCVSALNRNIYMSDLNAEIEYIQTDAAINSGNSGGAFINEYGQVVGISAAKMKVEAGYEGMGFAIPINNAKIVIDSLIEHGYVAGRPRVGIEYKAISSTLAELNSIPVGLRVYTVYEDVDAYNHIYPGDIITKFDGNEVYDIESVATALSGKVAGEELVVTIYRVDEETGISEYIDVTIILSESVGEKLAETMN